MPLGPEDELPLPVDTETLENIAIRLATQVAQVVAKRLAAGEATDRTVGVKNYESFTRAVDRIQELARSGLPDEIRAKRLAYYFFGMRLAIGLDDSNSFGSSPAVPTEEELLDLQLTCYELVGAYDNPFH